MIAGFELLVPGIRPSSMIKREVAATVASRATATKDTSRMNNALGQCADRSPRRAASACLALCLMLFAAPAFPATDPTADLPTLGDGSSRIVSPAMEKQIGRQFLKQINAVLPTIDDPILKYYVETAHRRSGPVLPAEGKGAGGGADRFGSGERLRRARRGWLV